LRHTIGFAIDILAFLFGFAMIWHIWWLALGFALGILATVIARSFNDYIEYIIPASEVERIESERRRTLEQVWARQLADTIPKPVPVLQVQTMTSDAHAIDTNHGAEYDHHDAQENQAFGFWLYILSDLILFSALFATFAVQMRAFAGGPIGKDLFDLSYVASELRSDFPLVISTATNCPGFPWR